MPMLPRFPRCPWAPKALAATLTFAALTAPVASAENPEARNLRASVTQEVIARWAPDVHFHWHEKYFPASAEELFAGAATFQVDDDEKESGTARIIHQPSDLAFLDKTWRIRYDSRNTKVMGGDIVGNDNHRGVVTAPMYVSVMVPEDASFVDIRYCFLFGFNGAQCMRTLSATGHFNYIMPTLAEHQGDWEGFTLRLTPDLKTMIYGVTEAHGNQHKYPAFQMDWTDGTHPQLRLGLDSHGVYNGKGKNDNDWIVLSENGPNECVDIITKDGPVWQPWKLPASTRPFRLFGRTNDNNLIGETWANFHGRMGSHKTNGADKVLDVSGGGLDGGQAFIAGSEMALTGAVTLFKSELCNAMPCGGPGGREEMNAELPPMPPLKGLKKWVVRSTVNTFRGYLTVGQDGSSLVLDQLHPGDPKQQWYWLDLGNEHFQLINVATERAACVDPHNGSPAYLIHRSRVDEYTMWNPANAGQGTFALRPLWDTGQNLNVLGGGGWQPGNAVGTWGWGRGQENERWAFEAADLPAAPGGNPLAGLENQLKWTLRSRINTFTGYLTVGPDGTNVELDPARPGDLKQGWFWVDKGSSHFQLISRCNGKALCVDARNGSRAYLVDRSKVDGFTLWSPASAGDGAYALRPLWDFGQNLNVFGDNWRPGGQVGTWGWGGGQGNETWVFEKQN